MNQINLLAEQVVALQKSHRRLQRITTTLGVFLGLFFLVAASAKTVIDGDVSVSGLLKCLRLETDEAAVFTDDVTVKKSLVVEGTLTTPEIKEFRVIAKKLQSSALKVDSFPILIYSSGTNVGQAQIDSGKNYEFTIEASPSGQTWTHPRRFGSIVRAVWLVNERPDRGGSNLGSVSPSWTENQVSLLLSSVPNKGVIEARMFVLYSED